MRFSISNENAKKLLSCGVKPDGKSIFSKSEEVMLAHNMPLSLQNIQSIAIKLADSGIQNLSEELQLEKNIDLYQAVIGKIIQMCRYETFAEMREKMINNYYQYGKTDERWVKPAFDPDFDVANAIKYNQPLPPDVLSAVSNQPLQNVLIEMNIVTDCPDYRLTVALDEKLRKSIGA